MINAKFLECFFWQNTIAGISSSCCKAVFYESKARIFLLVDLREFFLSDLGSGRRKKINKKSSENDQLTGHFQSFFFFFFQFFFFFFFFF